MGRILYSLGVISLVLIFASPIFASGCGEAVRMETDAAGGGQGTTEPRVSETPTPEATVGTSASSLADEVTSPDDLPEFVSREETHGGRGDGADDLLAVRHGLHKGYERVVLDLGVGERPAQSAPEWSLSTTRGDGTVRVSLPSVSSTAVSDGALGDGFLKDFHVVRAPEGGVFVDIVSRDSFTYRAFDLKDPARVVVDFRGSDDQPDSRPPTSGGKTVLVSPRPGERANDPMTVSGYSRNFEGQNEVSLVDLQGETVASTTVPSNDWSETWGYFETSLNLPDDFKGPATLVVGTRSARDGKFEGVREPVFVERDPSS